VIVLALSGPNLNLLGDREPEVYGTATLADHVATLSDALGDGFTVEHVQSNHEGDLIDAIHGARGRCAASVINPGAFTH
jgi:3-dehydroquinate dehydratase-2